MSKKMTAREKKLRAEVREQLRADGIMPPKKAPLNRKKFAAQVLMDKDNTSDLFVLYTQDVPEAIACMIAGYDITGVTPEMMGVFKVLRIALDKRAFIDRLKEEGRDSYTYGELFKEVITPIIKL